jgi:hypothetical protein
MESKLNFQKTLTDGVNLGIKNIANLLLMAFLFLITFWIPYLNVGTTIGFYKNIIALSKGEDVVPMSIFSRDNYKNLGDFFLLLGLQTAGIGAAAAFLLFPAIVVSLAWQFAMYFFLDKGTSPLKSLSLSYDATLGDKWTLFFVYLACSILTGLIVGLLAAIPKVGGILAFLALIAFVAIIIGIEATLYKYFSSKIEEKAE